ncbi:hypothetical protein [Falsigemmobacter faecalis]|uniref:DUF4177 domain-containing protein n=1 Tax=Falsigemmobacter faecalis TaxID=2488730 RepID=A0A3P3DG29_9RHOB|nr:hypothetical protein [Falsigemmobacter faecalis]RRH72492.1 hypothetical protein EG244_14620 [Falsigemmobacter faecalis]
MPRAGLLCAFVAALLIAGPAAAGCFADYKAKQDDPLRLHYGVMQLPAAACRGGAAEAEIRRRLSGAGWTLLQVMSFFDEGGLAERKANAGGWFLRF